jgi:UDP-glucose 4-epimerase
MKRILVTGGTGYIGSHTVVELIQNGFEVIIIDNLSNSKIEVLDGIYNITGTKPDFVKLDLCDENAINSFFINNSNIEAVIHFAANKAVGESVNDSLKYYRNNLFSIINLLQQMKKYGIGKLVFSSSCTVYGQPIQLPVTEATELLPPNSPYGNTKQISEEIIMDSNISYKDLNAIILRYFNPIGAHPSSEIGELPNGIPTNLVPYLTQTVAGLRKELNVFGNDYNTPDGSCIRDYINVVDLAKAHVCALERMFKNENKQAVEIYNLGTGKGISVMEIINSFEIATGEKVKYKISVRRDGDVEQVWADCSKANKDLRWKANETIEDTLLSAWNWEKKINNINR